jgi:hypothetical protein
LNTAPDLTFSGREEAQLKGSQKPKKTQKKAAQKTLKERRVEKRAAEKQRRSNMV